MEWEGKGKQLRQAFPHSHTVLFGIAEPATHLIHLALQKQISRVQPTDTPVTYLRVSGTQLKVFRVNNA